MEVTINNDHQTTAQGKETNMSLLTKKIEANKSNAESTINWEVSLGWHEVRIVAVCDTGKEPNPYQDGKLQDKVSICFATDETVEVNGEILPKTKIEKFTASIGDNANLVTKVLAPAGISITSFDELLGRTLKLKFVEKVKGDKTYINIGNADESENPIDCPKDLYVPKFWIVQGGVETNNEILAEDGVIIGIAPKRAIPVAPIADADAIVIPEMPDMTNATSDEDMYA